MQAACQDIPYQSILLIYYSPLSIVVLCEHRMKSEDFEMLPQDWLIFCQAKELLQKCRSV